MDIYEAYQVLQADCGIKVGDTVKVLSAERFKRSGYRYAWDLGTPKDAYIGKEYVVDRVDKDGIIIKGYTFPFFVLEKIKDAETELTDQELWERFLKNNGANSEAAIIYHKRVAQKAGLDIK